MTSEERVGLAVLVVGGILAVVAVALMRAGAAPNPVPSPDPEPPFIPGS